MRLIDADALEAKLEEQRKLYIEMDMKGAEDLLVHDVLHHVWEAPTIDAVPVVRCKDCKYWDKDTLRHNSNDAAEWDECECEMLANRDRWNEIDRYCCGLHFCADGERRDDETD